MSLLFLVFILLLAIDIAEFSHFRSPVPNVSAVEATGNIGVYWDKNCEKRVDSLNWGVLSPGEIKEVVVYARNEGSESFVLVLSSLNWNPENASQYLYFSWSCADKMIKAGEVAQITQTLKVFSYISGISNFSFDIVFDAKDHFLGDINRDGVVDGRDLAILSEAYGSSPQDPTWNPDADLNKDGFVDFVDLSLFRTDFGKIWKF
jgi:hypothetical protein